MSLKTAFLTVSVLSVSLNANAALTSYTGSGGVGLVYSSISDVTWMQDGNLLGTMMVERGFDAMVHDIIASSPIISDTPNHYDTPSSSGTYKITFSDFSSSNLGSVNWFGAKAFVSYLNKINYGSSNTWTLPQLFNNGSVRDMAVGYNKTDSQFGQLYFNELGGTSGGNGCCYYSPFQAGVSLFSNEQVNAYWLNDERYDWAPPDFVGYPNYAYQFYTGAGYQGYYYKGIILGYAWAVSPGHIAAVPLPGAVWLFFSGFIGVCGLGRRIQKKSSNVL